MNINHGYLDDDATCIYVCAVLGFFFPIIGFIGMCVNQCGSKLGPKKSKAFKTLVILTILGIVCYVVLPIIFGFVAFGVASKEISNMHSEHINQMKQAQDFHSTYYNYY